VGGTPEILEDGQSGLLVPPDDPVALSSAIGHLAEDAGLCQRLGAAARATAAGRFDISERAEFVARVWRELAVS